ncbi:MAG TPA: sigma-70 family RNA polymerase sigma factor [Galbitalea sp.]|nr:sigma-70 family RNA polymerase sigma factor [Galbitalea sp.]
MRVDTLSLLDVAADPSERALFDRVQAGDREAFRVIFRLHMQSVYWAAFGVLQSRSDSEEVMQDTFMMMWEKRAGIELVGESTLPWLVTSARYLALNRRRAEGRRRRDPLDENADILDRALAPDNAAVANEARQHIEEVMAQMPLVDQEIFWLCLVGDLSYKQAARQLGISHGAVRNRLSRLKARLRNEISLLKGD